MAGSIWVAWIKSYRLKNCDIWSVESKPYHSWFWKRILKVRSQASAQFSFDEDGDVCWQGKLMPQFSVLTVYDTLCYRKPLVNWRELIWSKPQIPKHCFISWLAVQRRLVAKEDMSKWGISLDISCLLCDKGVDCIDHIMVDCEYVNPLKLLIYGQQGVTKTWEQEILVAVGKCTGGSDQAKRKRLLWRAVISLVWYERCRRNEGVLPRTCDALHSIILSECDCILP
ncbi:hypothetical protein LINPERPRIM_LOCUS6402 [Linum perenne]